MSINDWQLEPAFRLEEVQLLSQAQAGCVHSLEQLMITYEPWVGQDAGNIDFADADETAVRLDPVSPGTTIDITQEVDYTSHSVPNWSTSGGSSNVSVNDYYIPRYYTSTDTPPLAWNSQKTLQLRGPISSSGWTNRSVASSKLNRLMSLPT